ncbi:MAG: hypothetical protein MJE66_04260 [Proteobacteria bacterium]|nr:hypothetical protein [Pseudomonadota bacterium]
MRRAHILILVGLVLVGASVAAGAWVSSRVGQATLRAEAEHQLARVLKGPAEIDRTRLLLRLGLRLEGEGVRAYPSAPGTSGPGHQLTAERVAAGVDVLSLLIGRFRLRWLLVEDGHFHITRSAEGAWAPYPVAFVTRKRPPPPAGAEGEKLLGVVRAAEATARALFERPLAANRVQLRNATVSLADRFPTALEQPPVFIALEQVDGVLEHSWFSDRAELVLEGVLVGGAGQRTPIEIRGRRESDGGLRLTVALREFPLDLLDPYARVQHPDGTLSGRLTGVVDVLTYGRDQSTVELDWVVRDLATAVPRPGSSPSVPIRTPHLSLRTFVEVTENRLRVREARLRGGVIDLAATAAAERPLGPRSAVRVDLELQALSLVEIQSLVGWLPEESRDRLAPWLERFQAGRLLSAGTRGSAHVENWRKLLAGHTRRLPRGFVVHGTLDGVELQTTEGNRLTDLSGRVEWSGDRLEIHEARAQLNDTQLPTIEATVSGVSHVLASPPEARQLEARASALPGLGALVRLFDRPNDAEREPTTVHLEIDELDHPALAWPLRDLRASLHAPPGSLQITAESGRFGGVPVRGEAVWTFDEERRFHLSLIASPPPAGEAPEAEPAPEPRPPRDPNVWARGRLRINSFRLAELALEPVTGRIDLQGTKLAFSELEAPLPVSGSVRGHATVDLSESAEVGLRADFALSEADVDALGHGLGLPAGFATGRAKLVASLSGHMRPGDPLAAGIDGVISLEAREGEIRQKLPVIAAVALASEVFNPLWDRDAIRYDQVDSVLDLEDGLMVTESFAIEGPDVRVLASGKVDLARPPHEIQAVVALKVFRTLQPLNLLPNFDEGLLVAYFEVDGPWAKPESRPLALRSLAGSIMPTFVTKGLQVLRDQLLGNGKAQPRGPGTRRRNRRAPPAEPAP